MYDGACSLLGPPADAMSPVVGESDGEADAECRTFATACTTCGRTGRSRRSNPACVVLDKEELRSIGTVVGGVDEDESVSFC